MSDPEYSLGSKQCPVVRRLDPTECFWHAFNHIGGLMIINNVSLVSTHPIDIGTIQKAADILTNRHQALRLCIRLSDAEKHIRGTESPPIGGRAQYVFQELTPPIPIDIQDAKHPDELTTSGICWDNIQDVGILKETKWMKAMLYEQSIPFDCETGPLWRLRVLRSETVESFDDPYKTHFPPVDKASDLINPITPEKTKDVNPQNFRSHAIMSRWNSKKGPIYRTFIIGCFHHSVMDGLSRQIFWNELLKCITLIENEKQYQIYIQNVIEQVKKSFINLQSYCPKSPSDEMNSPDGTVYAPLEYNDSSDISLCPTTASTPARYLSPSTHYAKDLNSFSRSTKSSKIKTKNIKKEKR